LALQKNLLLIEQLELGENLKEPIERVLALGDFKASIGESSLLYTIGDAKPDRVILFGLGRMDQINIEKLRDSLGEVSRKISDLGIHEVSISLHHLARGRLDEAEVAKAAVEAFIMGSFKDPFYKTRDLDKIRSIESLNLIASTNDDKIIEAAESGRIVADAVNLCRRLAWGSPNRVTPTKLAEEAESLHKYGVKTRILGRDEAKKACLYSFVTVSKGASEQPKFIIMEYGSSNNKTVGLVGKGITFDSGGISLKPSEKLHLMKGDMTGGSAVIAAVKAVAQLKLPIHIVAIVPDGGAYHPGDVVDTYSGLTVEVISTDAEGRMILNDALYYLARNYKPEVLFDFATLTSAMEIALGEHAIGYFSNDDSVAESIEAASRSSCERVWRMPLWDLYDEQLKSDVADLKHTGIRPGGAITAARFLSKFVIDTPWAHFDIAGQDESERDKGCNPKGSRGPAVRLIIELLKEWINRPINTGDVKSRRVVLDA
jgi:leucyl aminopeptidase